MAEVVFNRVSHDLDTYLSRIPDNDRELVQNFIKYRNTQQKTSRNISRGRERKIIFSLSVIRSLSPVPFASLTDSHITDIVSGIKEKGWKGNSTRDAIAICKMFLMWLADTEKAPHLTEKAVKKIPVPAIEDPNIEAKDLLTQEEVDAIIKLARPRDRAIISLLADTAARPIEIGTLTLGQCEIKDNLLHIHITSLKGKKPRKRRIPAPNALFYLEQWINLAPYEIMKDDDLLFRSLRFDKDRKEYPAIKDDVIRWCIKDAARRANVSRYRSPYQFRHRGISLWLDSGMSTAQVSLLSHGGASPIVERIYFHGDMKKAGDDLLVKIHGREKKERVIVNPTSRVCKGCGKIYPLSIQFCGTCGPLTETAKSELKTIQEIAKNQFQEIIAEMTPAEKAQILDDVISNLTS